MKCHAFQAAGETSRSIGDPVCRVQALCALGVAQSTDDTAIADKFAWQGALDAAREIQETDSLAQALRDIAEAQARAGRLDEAISPAQRSGAGKAKAWAFHSIAEVQAKTGRLDVALAVIRNIEIAEVGLNALCGLVRARTHAGHLEEALQLARSISDGQGRAY